MQSTGAANAREYRDNSDEDNADPSDNGSDDEDDATQHEDDGEEEHEEAEGSEHIDSDGPAGTALPPATPPIIDSAGLVRKQLSNQF